jgi:hypothetical protein
MVLAPFLRELWKSSFQIPLYGSHIPTIPSPTGEQKAQRSFQYKPDIEPRFGCVVGDAMV